MNRLPKSLQDLARDFMKSKIYEDGHVRHLQHVISFNRREIHRLDKYQVRYHQRMTVIRRLNRQLLAFQEFRSNAAEYRRQKKDLREMRQRIGVLQRTLRAIRRTRRQLTEDNQKICVIKKFA